MAYLTLRQSNVVQSFNATVKGSPLTNSEVDNNFANLNVDIGNLEALTVSSSSANLVAALNTLSFVGNGAANLSFSASTGNITISGNLVPSVDNVVTLGAPGKVFRDLYLSGNSLYLGNILLSEVGGNVAIGGVQVLSTSGKAATNSVVEDSIASSAVTEGKIGSSAVTEAKIGSSAVTEAKIGSGAVTEAKIGSEAVSSSKLTSNIDLRGTLKLPVGNAVAPSLAANAGSSTGVFFPSTDAVAISTAGVERANVDALGFFTGIYSDKTIALGNSGTATTINTRLGTVFTATLTGSCTFTVANAKSTGATSFTLVLTNDGTPSRSVALAGGTFRYPNGALARTTTANAIDVWFFITVDGGSNWYVNIPLKALATGTIS